MKKLIPFLLLSFITLSSIANDTKTYFSGDFSPAVGLTTQAELKCRHEVCLNGLWEVQCIDVPSDWKDGTGVPPELTLPDAQAWETTKIKIPSPINVNDWGKGYHTGEGTEHPLTPSTIYFPSYPEHWNDARMAWLRRSVKTPKQWKGLRHILHFEAVSGECCIMVNGKEVARNFDSHTPFDVDITNETAQGETFELMVGVRKSNLFNKKSPNYIYARTTYPSGSSTDGLLGIWQDVYLNAIPQVSIADVFAKPLVDQNLLSFTVTIINNSSKKQSLRLCGDVKSWINDAGSDVISAAEPKYHLGETIFNIQSDKITLRPGETKVIEIKRQINDELKYWTPDTPNLYALLLHAKKGSRTIDLKETRFGWRQLKISGRNFLLNGNKVQCFGDIQHPFSAFICSRRFAYAWFQMIKDLGGNSVRMHAQPWPRCYYDLADEMGLMVLDESGLFGSAVSANFEEEISWERYADQIRRLVLRDRNHPSVIGWSPGNETYAITLYNKPSEETRQQWYDRLKALADTARYYDGTRDFITFDGDEDVDGRMHVWSKHFAHGLHLENLPADITKPIVVGECCATYYGRPDQLYPFSGDRAYASYYGHSEALAIDLYQNIRQMAIPYTAYFSPSEVCWFGNEHLNLGYHDFTRLPDINDGIFPSKPYEEGKPGYQYERIPPYVTTFNPGLDPSLPLYKPLPLFYAYKAALKGEPWQPFLDLKHPEKPALPQPTATHAVIINHDGAPQLSKMLANCGVRIDNTDNNNAIFIVDASSATQQDIESINRILCHPEHHPRHPELDSGSPSVRTENTQPSTIILAFATDGISQHFAELFHNQIAFTDFKATALIPNQQHSWCYGLEVSDAHFADAGDNKYIVKTAITGPILDQADILFEPSKTDWSLFNWVGEEWKCAQVVLNEQLYRPRSAAFITFQPQPSKAATIAMTTIDWRSPTGEAQRLWQFLFPRIGVKLYDDVKIDITKTKRAHNLLLDGPMQQ
ncbi:MAG: glycoside hydrolase family 2 TIM barrel-domain containing protein [Prevotellaceae bacterium]|nr:glycoside hydrolase family 2 TIM barrel-domain containing protein [Prevotellaceae bacterium]